MLGKKTVRSRSVYFSASYDAAQSASPDSTRAATEAERLDGARALDGLRQRGGDLGVRRGLAQVAVLGAGEVPPQADDQRREREQAGQEHPPADAERGGEGQHRGDDRDRPLRQRPAHRPAEPVDVAAGAGEQVAGAGRLDGADRQGEGVLDEVLAQLGQHQLAHHLGAVAGVAGEHRLGHEEDRQPEDDLVDVVDGGAVLDGLARGRRAAAARPAPRGRPARAARARTTAARGWRCATCPT